MKTKRGTKGAKRHVWYCNILSSGSASVAVDNHPTSFTCDNSSWTILTSPGDGHCSLHSVLSSYGHQLPHLPGISMDYVITALSNETISDSEYYLPFTEDLSIIALRRGLRSYIMDKHFHQSFCDLVPMILANAFKLSITILNQNTDGLFIPVTFSPTPAHCSSVFLHRIGDHYNGLLCTAGVTPSAAPEPDISTTSTSLPTISSPHRSQHAPIVTSSPNETPEIKTNVKRNASNVSKL